LRPLDVARLRAVVDTSSLVRAALNADSAAGRLIERLLSGDSDSELVNVLERPKFRQRLAQEYRRRFLLYLQATAFFVVPEQRVEVCRDPADNVVLEAALAFGNDVIVVLDDRDLLVLDPWRDIRIVKPEAALAMYEVNQPVNRTRGAQP
jgi:putative PIN family toxin of toxin-antitoxin system